MYIHTDGKTDIWYISLPEQPHSPIHLGTMPTPPPPVYGPVTHLVVDPLIAPYIFKYNQWKC